MLPIQCADIEVEIVTVGIDCPSPAGLQLSAVVVVIVVCNAGGRLATRGPGGSKQRIVVDQNQLCDRSREGTRRLISLKDESKCISRKKAIPRIFSDVKN